MLSLSPQTTSDQAAQEPYRPKYHFTAAQHWINDPNGLVYYDGEYHLFYQYYPKDIVWGPMHWGHAVSRDLVHWEYLPIALYPDELGMIFSGSAVIDWDNSAGFGKNAMVAIFTHHNPETLVQSQSIAYSLDCGRSWTKYAENPVIEPPTDMKDFRDPKVIWYDAGDGSGHWVMCLAAGTAVDFYISTNLREWEMSGRFGYGYGSVAGVWETPDFFKLPVRNGSKTYWVLSVGVIEGGPAGGSGTQYFVGIFDGKNFTAHYERETVLWVDHGADFYAVQSWNNMPDGRRVWLAWMDNWQYGLHTPATTWRGAMTVPREVVLVETADGPRLVQNPIKELQRLRKGEQRWQDVVIQSNASFSPDIRGKSLEIIADFEVPEAKTAEDFGIRVRVGEVVHTTVGYWTSRRMLFTDRCRSGNVDFDQLFATVHGAKLEPEDGLLRLHLFLDCCSLEVFANEGIVCFTEL
ncbi:MAG: glycoside hydrolase family 32 protein, partial [Candidatus Promineifilaceae bacterium]